MLRKHELYKACNVIQLDSMALCVVYWTLFFCVIVDRIAIGIQIDKAYQVELIEGLNLFNASYGGVALVDGYHHWSPAVLLREELRELRLPTEVCRKASEILSRSNEFTLMVTLRQEERNAGTILSFSEGNSRYLELQSSGRKNEIRLHYNHNNMIYVETFPYRLADNSWHQLAMTVSGNNVAVYVDCNRIYKRVINDIDRNFTSKNLSLWLGQRNFRHFFFKGILQDVRIVGKPHGYVLQCPHLETDCPTCGQFKQLQVSVKGLENHVRNLIERLAIAEQRIAAVEECECKKHCRVNGSDHLDGTTWQSGCEICFCKHGSITCKPIDCPPPKCKLPVMKTENECCPKCPSQCLLDGIEYNHGDQFVVKQCVTCECHDGTVECRKIDPEASCPPLNCSKHLQFTVPEECCRYCPGTDFCAQGHNCHVNASCHNLKTKHVCQCKRGYQGNGVNCEDVDECKTEGGHYGHHCRPNTVCVNIPGSYVCECLDGYKRMDAFSCIEHDECRSNDHNCDENAVCINTEGSYTCQCKEGYRGDGFVCEPICNEICLNGGKCVAPGLCGCQRGYTGTSCEIDIDECSLGVHVCHPNARCINMPGWYYCECRKGYQSHYKNRLGIFCEDIDECKLESHTCHYSATCVNEDGSFRCECGNNTTCSSNCIYYGEEKNNGETWISPTDPCSHCSCYNGVVSCEQSSCDCSNSNIDLICCPQCDETSICQHQETATSFRNGDKWTYQCQTCECLYGEIDCWEIECPPVSCDNPVHQPGDCCLRCQDEPCLVDTKSNKNNSTLNIGCTYHGHMYKSGETVPIVQDPCASCKCQVPLCEHSVSNTGYSSHRMDSSAARIIPVVWIILLSLLLTCPHNTIVRIWRVVIIMNKLFPLKKRVKWKTQFHHLYLFFLPLLQCPIWRMGSYFNNCFPCQRTSHLQTVSKVKPAAGSSFNTHKIPI